MQPMSSPDLPSSSSRSDPTATIHPPAFTYQELHSSLSISSVSSSNMASRRQQHPALLPLVLLAAATVLPSASLAAVAPGPTPAPLNVTAILEKGGQFTTLLRLFKETQVGEQLESQLNSSFDGITLFAPTDNAFSKLKPGTLNSLTAQEQVQLVLYHVLPRFYSLTSFETASNPLRTQASGDNGVYTVNVTSTSQQVNVSTGVNAAPINNALYSTFPLSIFSIDSVLEPVDLFGVKAPSAAPEPAPAKLKPKKGKPEVTATAAEPAAAEADTSPTPDKAAAAVNARVGSFLGVAVAVAFASVATMMG